jgi:cyclin-dependent kinase regulatory subunit CKS1
MLVSFFVICSPEPHILLFRRALGTNPQTGRIDPELVEMARAEFKDQMGLRQNAVA